MKRITLDQIEEKFKNKSYQELCQYMFTQIAEEKLKPVKTSGKNGKTPVLYREYWICEKIDEKEQKFNSELEEELRFHFTPQINIDYYLSHLDIYKQDRLWVQMLDTYLKEQAHKRKLSESINERSFEIWNREKFLLKEQGRRVLKRCGLTLEDLNLYQTTEPLAYYGHTKEVPQNVLILENKDTFYSMRRHLLNGSGVILGMEIGTLIYGAGKGILRSFQDFQLCVEPYINAPANTIYYFGDLDYEGILIYEKLAGLFAEHHTILPYQTGYLSMLKKAKDQNIRYPETKEKQNRQIGTLFFSYFENKDQNEMKDILERELYIPQEILNIGDF